MRQHRHTPLRALSQSRTDRPRARLIPNHRLESINASRSRIRRYNPLGQPPQLVPKLPRQHLPLVCSARFATERPKLHPKRPTASTARGARISATSSNAARAGRERGNPPTTATSSGPGTLPRNRKRAPSPSRAADSRCRPRAGPRTAGRTRVASRTRVAGRPRAAGRRRTRHSGSPIIRKRSRTSMCSPHLWRRLSRLAASSQ
jgi:hypothetical protein